MVEQGQERRGCLLWLAGLFGGGKSPRSVVEAGADDEALPLSSGAPTYALRDDFLSPAETSFFHVLQAAAPADQLVFPKVHLADLIYAPKQDGHYAAWQRINRKHVDFVLCDARILRPLLAIELDDRSHRRPDRLERDAFVDQVFATAGLAVLHLPVRHAYNTQELAGLLAETLSQRVMPTATAMEDGDKHPEHPHTCSRCGGAMQLRVAKQGQHAGERFWGCANYPRCRNTVPV